MCVSVFGVCLSVAQLWDLLILTREAASTTLPVPPPASTWKTDRQTDSSPPSLSNSVSPDSHSGLTGVHLGSDEPALSLHIP